MPYIQKITYELTANPDVTNEAMQFVCERMEVGCIQRSKNVWEISTDSIDKIFWLGMNINALLDEWDRHFKPA